MEAAHVVDERMQNLRLAVTVKQERRIEKELLKNGDRRGSAIIANPSRAWKGANVEELLRSCPKIGDIKVARILTAAAVSPRKKVGELTKRQRNGIVAAVRSKVPRAPF